ncbi:response regulator [Candidatus Parcubacteria bacterium]|nr:response regulator [Candidatus Parcubacteria bacterium]
MTKKIIIMEDEEILQSLLKKKLEANGYEILVANNGEEGINLIKDGFMPDLILLDIVMPIKDGFEVLHDLRANDKFSSIPVIIISNSGEPVEIERIKKFDIVDYLIKADFDPTEVLEKVSNFFNNTQKIAKREPVIEKNDKTEIEEEEEEISVDENKKGGLKVILAEDDDFLRDICETKFKKEGFDVSSACDGVEALAKIKEEDPEIILLDIIMPKMDGFEVLKKIKEIPEKASIPVIMLTNLGQTSEIEKGFALGAEDYIIKAHFTVGEIIEKVREIVEKKKKKK